MRRHLETRSATAPPALWLDHFRTELPQSGDGGRSEEHGTRGVCGVAGQLSLERGGDLQRLLPGRAGGSPGRTAAWTAVGPLGAAVSLPSGRTADWAGLVCQQLRDRPIALVAFL